MAVVAHNTAVNLIIEFTPEFLLMAISAAVVVDMVRKGPSKQIRPIGRNANLLGQTSDPSRAFSAPLPLTGQLTVRPMVDHIGIADIAEAKVQLRIGCCLANKGTGNREARRTKIRGELLDAAEDLIREGGYGSATARAVAERVGLKHQVVFYYFGNQDDLLIEVYRRVVARYREKLAAAFDADAPLTEIWKCIKDPEMVRFGIEFAALAGHNETMRKEFVATTESIRTLECAAISRHFKERGIEPRLDPATVSILSNAVARFLAQEASFGVQMGHAEVEGLIEGSFRAFEHFGEASAEMQPLIAALTVKPPAD